MRSATTTTTTTASASGAGAGDGSDDDGDHVRLLPPEFYSAPGKGARQLAESLRAKQIERTKNNRAHRMSYGESLEDDLPATSAMLAAARDNHSRHRRRRRRRRRRDAYDDGDVYEQQQPQQQQHQPQEDVHHVLLAGPASVPMDVTGWRDTRNHIVRQHKKLHHTHTHSQSSPALRVATSKSKQNAHAAAEAALQNVNDMAEALYDRLASQQDMAVTRSRGRIGAGQRKRMRRLGSHAYRNQYEKLRRTVNKTTGVDREGDRALARINTDGFTVQARHFGGRSGAAIAGGHSPIRGVPLVHRSLNLSDADFRAVNVVDTDGNNRAAKPHRRRHSSPHKSRVHRTPATDDSEADEARGKLSIVLTQAQERARPSAPTTSAPMTTSKSPRSRPPTHVVSVFSTRELEDIYVIYKVLCDSTAAAAHNGLSVLVPGRTASSSTTSSPSPSKKKRHPRSRTAKAKPSNSSSTSSSVAFLDKAVDETRTATIRARAATALGMSALGGRQEGVSLESFVALLERQGYVFPSEFVSRMYHRVLLLSRGTNKQVPTPTSLTFPAYTAALTLLLRGSLRKQAEFCYGVFDLDNDGIVSRQDIFALMNMGLDQDLQSDFLVLCSAASDVYVEEEKSAIEFTTADQHHDEILYWSHELEHLREQFQRQQLREHDKHARSTKDASPVVDGSMVQFVHRKHVAAQVSSWTSWSALLQNSGAISKRQYVRAFRRSRNRSQLVHLLATAMFFHFKNEEEDILQLARPGMDPLDAADHHSVAGVKTAEISPMDAATSDLLSMLASDKRCGFDVVQLEVLKRHFLHAIGRDDLLDDDARAAAADQQLWNAHLNLQQFSTIMQRFVKHQISSMVTHSTPTGKVSLSASEARKSRAAARRTSLWASKTAAIVDPQARGLQKSVPGERADRGVASGTSGTSNMIATPFGLDENTLTDPHRLIDHIMFAFDYVGNQQVPFREFVFGLSTLVYGDLDSLAAFWFRAFCAGQTMMSVRQAIYFVDSSVLFPGAAPHVTEAVFNVLLTKMVSRERLRLTLSQFRAAIHDAAAHYAEEQRRKVLNAELDFMSKEQARALVNGAFTFDADSDDRRLAVTDERVAGAADDNKEDASEQATTTTLTIITPTSSDKPSANTLQANTQVKQKAKHVRLVVPFQRPRSGSVAEANVERDAMRFHAEVAQHMVHMHLKDQRTGAAADAHKRHASEIRAGRVPIALHPAAADSRDDAAHDGGDDEHEHNHKPNTDRHSDDDSPPLSPSGKSGRPRSPPASGRLSARVHRPVPGTPSEHHEVVHHHVTRAVRRLRHILSRQHGPGELWKQLQKQALIQGQREPLDKDSNNDRVQGKGKGKGKGKLHDPLLGADQRRSALQKNEDEIIDKHLALMQKRLFRGVTEQLRQSVPIFAPILSMKEVMRLPAALAHRMGARLRLNQAAKKVVLLRHAFASSASADHHDSQQDDQNKSSSSSSSSPAWRKRVGDGGAKRRFDYRVHDEDNDSGRGDGRTDGEGNSRNGVGEAEQHDEDEEDVAANRDKAALLHRDHSSTKHMRRVRMAKAVHSLHSAKNGDGSHDLYDRLGLQPSGAAEEAAPAAHGLRPGKGKGKNAGRNRRRTMML